MSSSSPASPAVRDRIVGALRITLFWTPLGFVAASERTGAPATRTDGKPAGWAATVARFDALVSAARTVQL